MRNVKEKLTATLIAIMAIVLFALLNGCSPSLYKNNKKINITHVLAVTEMGDTLKIPIEAIRPNVIYNVMGYSYGMRPYYRPYNYTYDFYPYNYGNNNNINYSTSKPRPTTPISSGSGSNISNPNLVKPPNPVTNGSGGKKKNN